MHVLTQTVLQGTSGLPEDVYVNTWHWDYDGILLTSAAAAIEPRLDEFYNGNQSNAIRLREYLSADMVSGVTYRHYNMDLPPPRVPVVATAGWAPNGTAGNPLPTEVSLVQSFYATPSLPRRRGRNYLGPLQGTAVAFANGEVQPDAAFLQSISDHAAFLAGQNDGTLDWCVYSKTNDELMPVTNGWVDNEFDTQRRRGRESTSRLSW